METIFEAKPPAVAVVMKLFEDGTTEGFPLGTDFLIGGSKRLTDERKAKERDTLEEVGVCVRVCSLEPSSSARWRWHDQRRRHLLGIPQEWEEQEKR